MSFTFFVVVELSSSYFTSSSTLSCEDSESFLFINLIKFIMIIKYGLIKFYIFILIVYLY